jgi:hypothetical protein
MGSVSGVMLGWYKAFTGLIISIKLKVLNDKGFGYRSAFVVCERVG